MAPFIAALLKGFASSMVSNMGSGGGGGAPPIQMPDESKPQQDNSISQHILGTINRQPMGQPFDVKNPEDWSSMMQPDGLGNRLKTDLVRGIFGGGWKF